MEIYKDKDFRKFLKKLNLLEYLQKNDPCSVREIKRKFKISKSEVYRKIDEWVQEGLVVKDNNHKERKYYAHFVIRKTPHLKIELLSLYDEIINLFSKRYKEIAEVARILDTRKEISKINVVE